GGREGPGAHPAPHRARGGGRTFRGGGGRVRELRTPRDLRRAAGAEAGGARDAVQPERPRCVLPRARSDAAIGRQIAAPIAPRRRRVARTRTLLFLASAAGGCAMLLAPFRAGTAHVMPFRPVGPEQVLHEAAPPAARGPPRR